MMMLRNVVEAVGVAVADEVAVVVMSKKLWPRPTKRQIPPVALSISMMISARSCSKRIRKTLSAYQREV